MASCDHIEAVEDVVPPVADVCRACVSLGDTWLHLRLCTACGEVACCDSSPNRHARAHAGEHGHPVVRSFEPAETWWWCYPDEGGVRARDGWPPARELLGG